MAIALPDRWVAIDMTQGGWEAVWGTLEGMDTAWADTARAMMSTEAMQQSTRLWATDPEPAGAGNAFLMIMDQPLPFPLTIDAICSQLDSAYEQVSLEVVDSACGLQMGGLPAARYVLHLQMGALAVQEVQYVILQPNTMWVLTFGVDAIAWDEYQPVFAAVAKSFWVAAPPE